MVRLGRFLRGHQPGHRRPARLGRQRSRRRGVGGRGCRRRSLRRLGWHDRLRAIPDPVSGVATDGRSSRRPGSSDDQRTGQAAESGPQRGGLRRRLPPLVCRGGQEGLRRDDPRTAIGPAFRRTPGPDRCLRGHHALELPGVDAHEEDRSGPGGRVHDGAQTGRTNTVVRHRSVRDPARRGRTSTVS